MNPKFKVWYHPYKNTENTESVISYANTAREAKAFARAFGIPFEVEAIYTISIKFRSHLQERNYACIELQNGAKCNFDFYWYAVELGILREEER